MSRKAPGFSQGLFIAWTAILATACSAALGSPNPPDPEPADGEPTCERECDAGEPTCERESDAPLTVEVELPSGREIARLGAEQCRAVLDASDLRYSLPQGDGYSAIEQPIRFEGSFDGIEVTSSSRSANNRTVDCRLAVALLAWAPTLRDAGIVRIGHMSTYRPGARVARSGRPSGHARAMAIDVATLHHRDGRVLDVEALWSTALRGADPCTSPGSDSEDLRLLRALFCDAVERDLFQVVLTPHYDHAHRNHVHLELRGDVDWMYVR